MAPTEELTDVAKRYLSCPSGYYYSGGGCYEYSSWYFWGRWVLAGVIVVFVVICLVFLGCCNARRRRRQGLAPRYGTGWMAGNKYGGYPNQNYGPAPPPYGQSAMPNQYTGNTFQSGDGYYGQHEGIQLQAPQNAYYPRGGDMYGPPAGPPPSKIA